MKKAYETPNIDIVNFTSFGSIMQDYNQDDGDKIYGDGMSDPDVGGDLPPVTGDVPPWM